MALIAASTLVADSAPAGRLAQALGIYGLSGLSTHAVAPAIGEFVLSMGGFHALFAVTTVYGAVGLSIASRIDEPTTGATLKGDSSSIWKVFTTPGFGPILLLGLVMGATLGSVLTYAPTYIRSRGIQWISLFYIAYTLTAIFLRVFLGRMSDRLGHRRVIVPGVLGMVVGVCLLSQADAQWMFGLAGLLNGAAHGLLYPALNALALGRAGQANYGKAQSLFASAFGAGMTGGIFLNGFVAEGLGYPAMYLWTAGWISVGLLLFRAWDRRVFQAETPEI
jgi:MFS family permease